MTWTFERIFLVWNHYRCTMRLSPHDLFFQLGFIPNPFGRHPGSDGALGHPFPCPRQYLQCNHHKLTQGRRTQRPSGKMCNRVSLLSINMRWIVQNVQLYRRARWNWRQESQLFKNAKIWYANNWPVFKLKYLNSGWSYSQASNSLFIIWILLWIWLHVNIFIFLQMTAF